VLSNDTPAAATVIAGRSVGIAAAPVPDLAQVRAILKATLRRSTRGRMIAGRSGKPRGLIFVLSCTRSWALPQHARVRPPDVFTFTW